MTPAAVRDFKARLAERIINDPAFAKALLDEATTLFRNGEPPAQRSRTPYGERGLRGWISRGNYARPLIAVLGCRQNIRTDFG